jgi:predicted MPP superfamily phosphohydrolase
VLRRTGFAAALIGVLSLLHGFPWWLLVWAPAWPGAVTVACTAVTVLAMAGFPLAMVLGHGPPARDAAAVTGDTWLGVIWQLFGWAFPGAAALGIAVAAGADPVTAARWTAVAVLVVVAALCVWGLVEALRTPRVRHTEVQLDRLGAGLDGLRVVLIADTHYGPIDRSGWSRRLVQLVNSLDADVLAHAGDLADGAVPRRRAQAGALADARAGLARVYITGNHEYFSDALGWVQFMASAGWEVLHNGHVTVRRGGDALVLAGIDDATAHRSGVAGHGADLTAALSGVQPGVPVLLLSHQPKTVTAAVAAGVDLQLSGHTHGGQIWPFHLLVRADQNVLHGLSRPGGRTLLYTTRGSGFWGPPFRVFAPSEVTVLTLRSPLRLADRVS